MIEGLKIHSPKRNSRLQTGWEGFFPYYAGYPEAFARALIESSSLPSGAVVLDPWNGSGTTTYTASRLGLTSIGLDLNPVMVIIARARLLAASEADSIEPLASDIVTRAIKAFKPVDHTDPLTWWFAPETASVIRAIERGIHRHLVGKMTMTPSGTKLDRISGIAATFYVALFTICRELAIPFRSSNPTWLRQPKESESKIAVPRMAITKRFSESLAGMGAALVVKDAQNDLLYHEHGRWDIRLADTTSAIVAAESVDLILTSPPYCTRIDYTAATRIELAILAPLLNSTDKELGRRMIGSTRVPSREIEPSNSWGPTCLDFLKKLRSHHSKASSGYYYKTHLDYFDKMSRSLSRITPALKQNGSAILVVQDSYYKEIHNNLPVIIGEMAQAEGLELARNEEFHLRRSMSGINKHTRAYKRTPGAVEAVLCFRKSETPR